MLNHLTVQLINALSGLQSANRASLRLSLTLRPLALLRVSAH